MPCPRRRGCTLLTATSAARRRPWDKPHSDRHFRFEEISDALPSRGGQRRWELCQNYSSPECAGAGAPKSRCSPCASLFPQPAAETTRRRIRQILLRATDRGRKPSLRHDPPLVRDFVGRYLLHKAGEVVIDVPEQHPSLSRVHVRRDRKIDQVGPGLSKSEIGLFGDGDILIRTLAEEISAQLQLRPGLLQGIFRHAAGGHVLQDAIITQPVG